VNTLQGGDWVGQGARAFYAEMNSAVLPSLKRLSKALQSAQRVTQHISREIKAAEDEAAAILKDNTGNIAEAKGSGAGKGFWGQVGGFFEGLYEGGKDTVTGLWNMVTHPIETVKGLGYAITHPGEVWEALKKPYVEDWESGNQGRAIGRGAFEVLSLIVPGGAATKSGKAASLMDKIGDVSRVARAANKADDLARITTTAERVAEASKLTKTFDLAEKAAAKTAILNKTDDLARIGAAGGDATAVADDIGRLATHGSGDRLVLGKYDELAKGGGYSAEARINGGRWYETPDDFYPKLKASVGDTKASELAWATNERFLVQQLESGVKQIDFVGQGIDDVMKTAPKSARAKEIRFLQEHAAKYGYEQVGNSWVKIHPGPVVPPIPPVRVVDPTKTGPKTGQETE
jgi:uncharacterized protein YukE